MMLNMEFNFIVNPLMGRKFNNPIIEYSADYSEYSIFFLTYTNFTDYPNIRPIIYFLNVYLLSAFQMITGLLPIIL